MPRSKTTPSDGSSVPVDNRSIVPHTSKYEDDRPPASSAIVGQRQPRSLQGARAPQPPPGRFRLVRAGREMSVGEIQEVLRVRRVTIGTGTGGRTPWRKDRVGTL